MPRRARRFDTYLVFAYIGVAVRLDFFASESYFLHMKIAFIGTHGVGKTTLCYELAAALKEQHAAIIDATALDLQRSADRLFIPSRDGL